MRRGSVMLPLHWLHAACVLMALAAAPARAQDGQPAVQDRQAVARDLIGSMAQAATGLNYRGVFVYQRGQRTDSMRIIHRAGPGGERERLLSLTGAPREVIRGPDSVTCIYPEDRAVMVERTRPRSLFVSAFDDTPMEEIVEHYVLAVLGRDRVAGREAAVVAVRPNLPDRYGHTLWIDAETGLLLKSAVVDSGGRVLEQTMFTEIGFPDVIDEAEVEPSLVGEGFTWHRSDAEAPTETLPATGEGDWSVAWLPEGFVLTEARTQPMAARSRPVRHLSFSDGLAMISVFVEPFEPAKQAMEGFSSLGAVNTYSRRSGDHQITVVGDVPPLAVRQVAESVAAGGT